MPIFILSAERNEITAKDLVKGYLRITVDFKHFFPATNQLVFVTIGSERREVKFSCRDNRSHLLHIGQDAISYLTLTDGDRICIEVIGEFEYRLSKLVP